MTANINSFGYRSETAAPWHGIGRTVDPGATVEEWATQAGFDWTVEKSSVFYRAGDTAQRSDKHKVFYRSDKPEVVLGTGSDKFHIAQPREFLNFLHQFGQETGVELETAGILGEGEKFFVLLNNHQAKDVTGHDGPTQDYILGASANNGSMSSVFKGTRVRVVCQNTLSMSLNDRAERLNISHRSRIDWGSVRTWLAGEQQDFQLFGDLMGALAQVPVDREQASDFAKGLLAPEWDSKLQPKAPRSLTRFVNTLQSGAGQREAGATAYGLLQGVTRYVDHEKQARGQESRLNSAWFGAGASLKQQGFDLLLRKCVETWGERSTLQPVLSETRYNHLLEAA